MRSWSALLAALLVSSVASAQVAPAPADSSQAPPPKKKKKKKKKKKPATTQPQPPPPPTNGGDDTDDDEEDDKPPPDYRGSPPKLNTDLKETDSSSPAGNGSNPWAKSGLVKTKGDDASSSSSSSSPASPAFPARGTISVEAFGGYASSILRIGFGARGGYTLGNNLYLGGAFTYHLGTRFGTATETFWYLAPELGYDYRVLAQVTLRPYAGLGIGVDHVSDASNILVPATTNAVFTFYPGFQADYQLPHSFVYVGADLRLVLAVGSGGPDPAVGFFLFAGGRF